jgi:hypothetical protein
MVIAQNLAIARYTPIHMTAFCGVWSRGKESEKKDFLIF